MHWLKSLMMPDLMFHLGQKKIQNVLYLQDNMKKCKMVHSTPTEAWWPNNLHDGHCFKQPGLEPCWVITVEPPFNVMPRPEH